MTSPPIVPPGRTCWALSFSRRAVPHRRSRVSEDLRRILKRWRCSGLAQALRASGSPATRARRRPVREGMKGADVVAPASAYVSASACSVLERAQSRRFPCHSLRPLVIAAHTAQPAKTTPFCRRHAGVVRKTVGAPSPQAQMGQPFSIY